ncbi:MAG: hypothetical protein ACREGF_07885 [Candidatus Saccharimonadales bacterium]
MATRVEQSGQVNGLAVGLIAVSIIAIIVIVVAAKLYKSDQNYKNNAGVLASQAAAGAKTAEQKILEQQFQQQNQSPFIQYTGPALYGSVNLSYPKNWSGYVDSSGGGGNPVEGYFNPGIVPALEDPSSVFALRLEINSSNYSTQLQQFTSQQQGSNLSITPYTLKQVPNVVGVMIQGAIFQNIQGVLVMFPDRTNTLEIWTESTQFSSLLENQILPSVTFSP